MTPERFAQGMTFDDYVKFTGSPENLAREGFDVRRFSTARPRLALHAFYCRWDKPQQQYQKALLRPETQAALSPPARALLALDDPDNDVMSAQGGQSGFMK